MSAPLLPASLPVGSSVCLLRRLRLSTALHSSLGRYCRLSLAAFAALSLSSTAVLAQSQSTGGGQSAGGGTTAAQSLPPITVETAKPAKAKPAKSRQRPGKAAPAAPLPASTPAPAPETPAPIPPAVAAGKAFVGDDSNDSGPISRPLTSATLGESALAPRRLGTSDTASLLRGLPGVSVASNGGTTGLPVIRGLMGDRIRTRVNGMEVTAACPNHMNPPLGYVTPEQVHTATVLAGLTPVSQGGDSIAGTLALDSTPPLYAAPGQEMRRTGSLSSFYRSNNRALGGALSGTMATEHASVTYDGAWNRARDYRAGGGARVSSTLYETQDHTVTAALRNDSQQLITQGGIRRIPYQGYANQRMDMTDNLGLFLNSRYEATYSWGKLDARAYGQHTAHKMNFLADKGGSPTGGMPMNSDALDLGYSIKADIPLLERDRIRIGNEGHHLGLEDWWPPVSGSMMMSPLTFRNIHDGRRNRIGTFAEWEARWSPQWSTLLGLRNDIVAMDTGDVQPYALTDTVGMGAMAMANPDAAAARAFNARNHRQVDVNFDVTALARYEPTADSRVEFGYARKTRSPNLYERYSWGTGGMSSSMIGWYGDANSYIGNLDLKPEVAHTVSTAFGLRDSHQGTWSATLTPYYSYVENFIDVDPVATLSNGFRRLRFANHDAVLYGVDLSGRLELLERDDLGRFTLTGSAGWVRGRRVDGGGDLYHIMPLHGAIGLEHTLGRWSNRAGLEMAGAKTHTDAVRNEPGTSSYALVNLSTGYQLLEALRLDFGIDNLFDTRYDLPLGGLSYGDYRERYGRSAPATARPGALPGQGRSFNVRMTAKF